MKTCTELDCGSAAIAKGFCQKHYMRQYRKGDTSDQRKNAAKPCVVEGCVRNATAYGYCHNHKNQAPQYAARREANLRRQREGRTCLYCGGPIPWGRNARAIYCSVEHKNAQRNDDGRQREAALRTYFKVRYGLTPEQVDEMAAKGCSICGTTGWTGRHARPHVDHDHVTGKVRGILCNECNIGLGKFKDDPALLRAAIRYLEGARVPS